MKIRSTTDLDVDVFVLRAHAARHVAVAAPLVDAGRRDATRGSAPSTLIRAGPGRSHTTTASFTADLVFRSAQPPHCLHWF
ncbi:hypothetical protein [Lentzea nigeriaca]|uniref:hypothetical protein n=1 Tax=Lentzea nigeriaca TaxID=1128665 RepID=UPI00195BB14E|nr:hypothetical protein [Lentzea nigeriaca]MBM7863870.1 hypothetical protein [Lentzea nigeriaca]